MDFTVHHFDLAGKGALGQIGQRGQHLAGLVAVVINGLLAQNDQAGLFFLHQHLEQFGHSQRLQLDSGLDQDGAVGANGHRGAQGFLALRDAAGHSDHLGDDALFFQANSLFDSNFVKGVHAHFDVGDVDARAVGLDPHLDVVIDHAFNAYQDFHAAAPDGYKLVCLLDVYVNCTDSMPLHISARHPNDVCSITYKIVRSCFFRIITLQTLRSLNRGATPSTLVHDPLRVRNLNAIGPQRGQNGAVDVRAQVHLPVLHVAHPVANRKLESVDTERR